MGKLTPGGQDMATTILSGTFSGIGAGGSSVFYGPFNVAVWGMFSATVAMERSFDGGTTFLPCSIDAAGDPASYTAPVSVTVNEPEHGVLYRANCTSYTSGTVNWRLSQSTDLYATSRGFQ